MVRKKLKVLIIDDDPRIELFFSSGIPAFEFAYARDGIEGIQMVSTEKPDLILLDIKMPGMSGLEVLEKLNKLSDRPEVVMISGHADTKFVVDSMRLGAAEFIEKPFKDIKEVEIHLNSVLERIELKEEVTALRKELHAKNYVSRFVGDSEPMTRVKSIVEQVADSELTVLIRGESGTGKEIAARSLHQLSSRRDKPFVKVNCAAIPRDLLEAELFGYEKGAFTGAHKMKQGRFESADKGTVFLDEIGDMAHELQSKLLQVLEQQEFVRVGGIQNIRVDVRIICATNRDLEQAIADKMFRDDLFYRLNEITLFLPPLRDRLDDIPLLVNYFLDKYNTMYQKEHNSLSHETISLLTSFNWPGNVRQLENMIKQVVVRQDEKIIAELISLASLRVIPTATQLTRQPVSALQPVGVATEENAEFGYSLKDRVGRTIADEEKRLISEVLTKTNWNRRKASEMLKISYRSLLYKIKDYNLNTVK